MNKYYKVVDASYENKLVSAIIFNTDITVIYKIGEWARPTIGKLFVFDDLNKAQEFKLNLDGLSKLFECECENPIKPNFERVLDMFFSWENSKKEVITFWSKPIPQYDGKEYSRTWNVMRNTIICDAVKLIKEVF